ncbi:MAG: AraC family transcriptional regulator [Planctomycetota bacterium]
MSIFDQLEHPPLPSSPPFFARRVRSARRYYLDLAPRERAPLTIVCGGYEECAPDYAIQREGFPYFVLEWVVRGRGRVCLDGRWRSVAEGSLFTYAPGVTHAIEVDAAKPLAKHFVSFSGRDAQRLLDDAGLGPPAVISTPRGADLPWLFEALLRDGSRGEPSGSRLCVALLRYLLCKIAASPGAAAGDGARLTFERCEAYLVRNASSLRSLGDLAEACRVDPAYLCRLYKRFSQQTPYQRLLWLRMHAAADKLVVDDRPIRVLAAELGYEDPFHFSRQFKNVFGVSPSGFRRLR